MRDTIYFYKRDLEKEINYLSKQLKNRELTGGFWVGHVNGLKRSLERLEDDIAYTKKLGDY